MAGEESGTAGLELNLGVLTQYSARYTVGGPAKCVLLVVQPLRDFPGGPVIKNLPLNAGRVASIPGWETKIPRAMGQLSLYTPTTKAHTPQLERNLSPTPMIDPACCN